jgi:hypothetical protein
MTHVRAQLRGRLIARVASIHRRWLHPTSGRRPDDGSCSNRTHPDGHRTQKPVRGVRTLDGIDDGHRGSVRRWLRQDHSCPHGWPCRPDTDCSPCLRRTVACVRSSAESLRPRRTSGHDLGGCAKDYSCLSMWPACDRQPGSRPGRRSSPTTARTLTLAGPRMPDISCPEVAVLEAADGQSADRHSLQLRLLCPRPAVRAAAYCGRLRPDKRS